MRQLANGLSDRCLGRILLRGESLVCSAPSFLPLICAKGVQVRENLRLTRCCIVQERTVRKVSGRMPQDCQYRHFSVRLSSLFSDTPRDSIDTVPTALFRTDAFYTRKAAGQFVKG